jgi:hypothetical protein
MADTGDAGQGLLACEEQLGRVLGHEGIHHDGQVRL